MVQLNKKRVGNIKELKEVEVDDKFKSWNLKTHDKELSYKEAINFNSAESRELQMKNLRDKATREGYIEIKNLDIIQKLFPYTPLDKFYQDAAAFFIWEYSGLTTLLDNKEEREKVFNALTEAEAAAVIGHLHSVGLTQKHLFINDEGQVEESRKRELKLMDSKGGFIMIKKEGEKGNPYPKRRPMYIDDFSLNQIKKAMSELKIKIPK